MSNLLLILLVILALLIAYAIYSSYTKKESIFGGAVKKEKKVVKKAKEKVVVEEPAVDVKPEHQHEYKMFVQEPWFSQIKDGKKTIEARRGKDGQLKESLGRELSLTNGVEEFRVKVVEIKHYDTLDEFIDAEYANAAPQAKDAKEAKKLYLEILSKDKQVFSEEAIKEKGGINALKLKLV